MEQQSFVRPRIQAHLGSKTKLPGARGSPCTGVTVFKMGLSLPWHEPVLAKAVRTVYLRNAVIIGWRLNGLLPKHHSVPRGPSVLSSLGAPLRSFSHFIKSGRAFSSGGSSKTLGLVLAPHRTAPSRADKKREHYDSTQGAARERERCQNLTKIPDK